jgi:hypothetical protein
VVLFLSRECKLPQCQAVFSLVQEVVVVTFPSRHLFILLIIREKRSWSTISSLEDAITRPYVSIGSEKQMYINEPSEHFLRGYTVFVREWRTSWQQLIRNSTRYALLHINYRNTDTFNLQVSRLFNLEIIHCSFGHVYDSFTDKLTYDKHYANNDYNLISGIKILDKIWYSLRNGTSTSGSR